MKLHEWKFDRYASEWHCGQLALCDLRVRTLFAIPHGVDHVWLSVHTHDAKGRLSISIEKGMDGVHVVARNEYYPMYGCWLPLFHKYEGKTLFVEVQYE